MEWSTKTGTERVRLAPSDFVSPLILSNSLCRIRIGAVRKRKTDRPVTPGCPAPVHRLVCRVPIDCRSLGRHIRLVFQTIQMRSRKCSRSLCSVCSPLVDFSVFCRSFCERYLNSPSNVGSTRCVPVLFPAKSTKVLLLKSELLLTHLTFN